MAGFVIYDNQNRIGEHNLPGRFPSLILANTFSPPVGPNTFKPGTDSGKAIVVQRNSVSGTGTLIAVQDEAGTDVVKLTSEVTGGGNVASVYFTDLANTKGYWYTATAGIAWQFYNRTAADIPIVVTGADGQTATLWQFRGYSSTAAERERAEVDVTAIDNTDASRKYAIVLYAWDTARREVCRGQADGTAANFSFFGAGSYGSGSKVVFVPNAGTNPSTNPTGGGILYSDAGAGKWRGSGGTTTTFGPAEPHCPVCGTDYGHEWDSQRWGRLHICINCLVDWIALRNGNRLPDWVQRR